MRRPGQFRMRFARGPIGPAFIVVVLDLLVTPALAGDWEDCLGSASDAALTAAKVPHEGYVYAGANHGFHNDTTPRYDEAAAKLAWQRSLEWFNKYLGAPKSI